MAPRPQPDPPARSIGTFFGPEPLNLIVGTLNHAGCIDRVTPGSDLVFGPTGRGVVGIEFLSLVHPDDMTLLSRSVRFATERSEGVCVIVRLRHESRIWAETRCLLCPLSEDPENHSVVFVLAQTITDAPAGRDADRIATLERHLRRFAAELHSGGWREALPVALDPIHLATLDSLPDRQREVIDRLLSGERIPTIAAEMYISNSTVRNHLSHVFTAFAVHSQSELLALLRSSTDTPEGPPDL